MNFTRVNNDTSGNPRYVVHFLTIANDYDVAVKLANKIGGKKYHNRQYGGGIVFQSYNLKSLKQKIESIKSKAFDLAL